MISNGAGGSGGGGATGEGGGGGYGASPPPRSVRWKQKEVVPLCTTGRQLPGTRFHSWHDAPTSCRVEWPWSAITERWYGWQP